MLQKIFDPENPVTRFLARIWDLIVLNALFLLCSLPIFTIGASLTALFDITLQIARGEESYLIKPFFESFKKNFKRATLLWLPQLASFVFFATDLYIIYKVIDESYLILQFPVWILLFFVVCVFLYSFPLTARFEETYTQTITNSIRLGIANIPTTIFFIIIPALLLDFGIHNPSIGVLIFSLFLFIGCSSLALLYSVFINRILARAQ